MTRILSVLIICLVGGCSSAQIDAIGRFAGLGVITEEKSGFDDSSIVNVSPTFLFDSQGSKNNVTLGARWSSAAPDHVALLLEYTSAVTAMGSMGEAYVNLHGIDINIGGKVQSYQTSNRTKLQSDPYNTVSESIYTTSSNRVVIPMDVFRAMLLAPDCRVRVRTGEGYEDSMFHIERDKYGQASAKVPLIKFLGVVDRYVSKSTEG